MATVGPTIHRGRRKGNPTPKRTQTSKTHADTTFNRVSTQPPQIADIACQTGVSHKMLEDNKSTEY